MVDAWASSGLSSRSTVKEYAASAGVNPRTLTWWKSKLKEAAPASFVGARRSPAELARMDLRTYVTTRLRPGDPELRGMPLGLTPVPLEDIQLLDTWIAQGRPE